MTLSSIAAAVVVTLMLGLLIWWRDEHPHLARTTGGLTPASNAIPGATGQVVAVPTTRSASPSVGPSIVPATEAPRPHEPQMLTDDMRERRRRVLAALKARQPAENPAAGATTSEPQGMKDRTGKMGPEVQALNEQLMPLVDQCFDQATERGVRQRGMLAVEVKLAGAEGIGRIIESVEPTPNNAINDPELIDCVRQSAFTVDLPPPSSTGSSELTLTIPFDGAPDAALRSR